MDNRNMDDLCRAAYYGHRDVVEVLLQQQKEERCKPDALSVSITPNESTTDGFPSEFPHDALQAALYSGRQGLEVAKWLLNHITDVNEEGGHFGNALQAACASGHVPSVQWLIEHGADVNSKGRYGSALKVACLCGYEDVVRLLLEAGARGGLSHGGHFDAFEAAASHNHLSTLTLLINNHPHKISLPKRFPLRGDNPLAPALRSACFRGHIDVVQYLLSNGAADSAALALEEALISRNEEIIRTLLGKLKVIPDYIRHEVMNCTVNDVLDLMPPTTPFGRSRKGVKAPSIDEDPHEESFLESIIHESLKESSGIQLQDRYVPDIDVDYPQGKRFIYRLVASRATPDVFERFVSKGMPLDGDSKPSLLEIAALHGNIDVVELLLDKNRPVGSALQCAVKAGREDIVRFILSKRPETPIDKVVNVPSLAEEPHDERNYPRWPETRRAVESPLALAMAWGHDAITEILLNHSKSAECPNPSLALVFQALEGNTSNVRKIFTQIYGPPSDLELSELGLETNAFHAARAAAVSGHFGVVDTILQHITSSQDIRLSYLKEITYEIAMNMNETSTNEAVINDQRELLGQIDEIASSSEREHFSGIKLLAIIHRNTIWGEDAKVKAILELHSMPPSEVFQTYLNKCLREALEMQNLRVASLLLEQPCLIDFVKNTPDILHAAMNSRHRRRWHGVISVNESEEFREIIKTLIRIGADVEGVDEYMRSPVYYACLYGLPETFQILLDQGASIAKVYSVTEAGVTGPSRSEQQGSHDEYLSIESVNLLNFTLGCINLKTKAQDTCERWGRIVFKLLDAGLAFESNDPNLGNLLYAFSASGGTIAVDKLLEYGVNPNAPVNPGVCEEHFGSALHVAAVTEQVEVLRILIAYGADVSAKRSCRRCFKGESEVTPIRAALQWGHESSKWDRFWEVCEILLEAGIGEDDCQGVLQLACERGNVQLAKRLLDSGTRLPEMPITLSLGILKLMVAHGTAIDTFTGIAGELQKQAARMASCEVLGYLVAEAGLSVSPRKIIAEVFSKKVIMPVEEQKRMLEFMLREGYITINGPYRCTCHKTWTNLFQKLISSRNVELIEMGLAHGADPQCPGCPDTAISLLFKNCSEWYRVEEVISVAEKLLDHGASIDGIKDVAELEDNPDQTPLLFALASSKPELVQFLISRGADVNRGVISPLAFAYWNKDKEKRAEFVKLLKSKSAVAKPIGQIDVMALHTGLRNGMPWLAFKYRYECEYIFRGGEDHY